MLGIPPRSVADAIVSLFLIERELTALSLRSLISERYFPVSLRAVYKELGKLLEQGIVIKVRDYYSLSVTWILNLIKLSEQLYTTSVSKKPRVTKLPAEGEKLVWKFHDLQHLDRFWIQLLFLLFEHSTSRTMFVWVPYFWFDLVHLSKDLEAQEAMKVAKNKMYMILGSRTFLDRLPTKYWSREVYEWSYAEGPFEDERSTYYDVIDDWILTVRLQDSTTREIHAFFQKIKSRTDLVRVPEFESIKIDAPAVVTLQRSKMKAAKFHAKFADFFGLSRPGRS
jgi:hypothetical protein